VRSLRSPYMSLVEYKRIQRHPFPSRQTCPTSSYLYAGSSSCSRHRELDLIEGFAMRCLFRAPKGQRSDRCPPFAAVPLASEAAAAAAQAKGDFVPPLSSEKDGGTNRQQPRYPTIRVSRLERRSGECASQSRHDPIAGSPDLAIFAQIDDEIAPRCGSWEKESSKTLFDFFDKEGSKHSRLAAKRR
jgi:hypothetical protein